MNFVAATCPNCSGSLQVPADRESVICMFCGSNIIVQQAVQLAAGRVQTFTTATEVRRQPSYQIFGLVLMGAALLLLVPLPELIRNAQFGGIAALILLAIALIGSGVLLFRFKAKTILLGYRGECPYCGTGVNFPVNAIGLDCFACKKRIVFRDMKFLSIDTPVGFARKP